MANSKIIVIEGAQGAGKTTITDYLRNSVKHTNLYRLSGISDSTKAGLQKSKKMYEDLNEYIKKMENLNINLLFDRTFFSEENYCRLGFKDYSFTEVYNKLLDDFSKMDFEIYYITLYLKDENLFKIGEKRALGRVWCVPPLNSGRNRCFGYRSTRQSPYGRLTARRLIREYRICS